MMKRLGQRWHCLPCHVTASESDADRKERARYGMGIGLGFRGIPMWVHVTLGVLMAAVWLIPRLVLINGTRGLAVPALEAAEPWSKKPTAEWPKFTLANEIELKGVPKSTGGLGFLIETGGGEILGATNSLRNALGTKEDEPSMTNAELNDRFVSWRMFAGTPDQAIAFRGFYGPPAAHSDGDVWLLRATAAKATLPVTPLKVRRTPLLRNMRLYVIARPADDSSGKERLFPCTVQDVALAGEVAELAYDKAVVSRGFAGAPVVDMLGHLAAIVTGPGEEPREDGAVTWLRAVGTTSLQRLTK